MRAFDTNIILRLMLDDDPVQVAIADRLIEEPAFVSVGVLMETAWVLKKLFGWSRDSIADALTSLIDIPTVCLVDDPGVRWAIGRYRDHGADLPDVLHIVAAKGASSFASFEKHLAREAGDQTPVPVERPT